MAYTTEGLGRTVRRARGARHEGPGAYSTEGPGRTVRRPQGMRYGGPGAYMSACSVLQVERAEAHLACAGLPRRAARRKIDAHLVRVRVRVRLGLRLGFGFG